jgi:hypothetical protein
LEIKECETCWAKIFIAGPIQVAEQVLREITFEGLCVNIFPNKYIYRGGEESGYIVELINYPRFPSTKAVLYNKALEVANTLMEKTFQGSFTVMCPDKTIFISRRDW